MRYLMTTAIVAALATTACKDTMREARVTSAKAEAPAMVLSVDKTALDAALDAQTDETKARYQHRHPAETLEFFGIAPGMVVVDALPGSEAKGWYTPILARYLGAGDTPGKIIAVDYASDMWGEFDFATPEFIAGKASWADEWVAGARARKAAGDFGDANVDFAATTFGGDNGAFAGMADAALLMRATHNLNRFEDEGGYMTEALEDIYAMLKPGGVVGVVQHRAPAGSDDDWADGSNGYVKQDVVIDAFKRAGFVYEGSSEINANPLDMPTSEDGVWRLPPTLGGSRDNPELKAAMEAIGESDRMTLKFRKPA